MKHETAIARLKKRRWSHSKGCHTITANSRGLGPATLAALDLNPHENLSFRENVKGENIDSRNDFRPTRRLVGEFMICLQGMDVLQSMAKKGLRFPHRRSYDRST